MKRCALSMLEMSEVREMREFGQVIDVIECHEDDGLELEEADGNVGEEDDFLFVDTSGFLQTPMNGMRRSASMSSFNTSNKQDLCLTSIMALPDIAEETLPQSPKESRPSVKNTGEDQQNVKKLERAAAAAVADVKFCDEKNQQEEQDKLQPSKPTSNIEDLDESTANILFSSSSNPLSSSLKHKDNFDMLEKSPPDVTSNLRPSMKSTDSTENKMKRNVSFSSLEIRSYNVTLGDAPTPNGPPVSLDWEYDPQSIVIEIDSFESSKKPRERHELLMPASHRKYLLMREAGFSRSEIQRAVDEAKRIAKGRERTRKHLCLMPVEEMLESTKRKFGRLVRKNSSEKLAK